MSYILDALKKSEQERGHGNIPNVQTVHTSSLSYKKTKAVWPYVLTVAVLLNLAAILYFFIHDDRRNDIAAQHNDTEEIATTIAGEATGKATTPEQAAAVMVNSSTQTSFANEHAPVSSTQKTDSLPLGTTSLGSTSLAPADSPAPASSIAVSQRDDRPHSSHAETVEYQELPESVRQQLPSIVVSAHVYSTNPLQRSIVINNNFLEEGEYVMDGLVLEEITPDGAILLYQGFRFHYGVVSGWQ